MITASDVHAAAVRIAGEIRQTPVFFAGPAWFKCEYMQHTGSFKARGALNRVLAAQESGELDPAIGIVIASGGNAGLANAYAAARAGVPATVFVPETAPAFKVAKLRALGATVVQRGSEYAAAQEAALKHAAETGALLSHAYDQPEIVAGAGTVGSELMAQLPGQIDTILVATGGGGLVAGIAAAVVSPAIDSGMPSATGATLASGHAARGVRVVAVEPASAPTLFTALREGGPVDVAVSGIAADSLGARRAGDIAYEVAVRTGLESVLVSDEDIAAARRQLWHDWRIVVEHGAAATLAALVSGAYVPAPDERVAIVLCGANTELSTDLSTGSFGA
jgi:threonine dehydratase